jgi:hypothetical protein
MADGLGIRLEYDETATPTASDVARLWFSRGREVFCADFVASIDRHGTPELIVETPEIMADPNPLPRNPDYEVFGRMVLDERFTLESRAYSAENWAWFEERIGSPFHRAWLSFDWIKDQRFRDGYTSDTERVEAKLGRYLKPVPPPTDYWWDTRLSNPYRSLRMPIGQ